MKEENQFFGCVGVVVLFIFAIVFSTIINGWVLSLMWEWFVVSIFNLPSLTIVQAIGLGMIVSYLTRASWKQSDGIKDRDWPTIIGELFSTAIFVPLLTIGLAWIILQFM